MNQTHERLEKLHTYTVNAYEHFRNNRYEDALTNLRKGCEAACRVFILEKEGERTGLIRLKNKNMLRDLLPLVKPSVSEAVYQRFEDIRYGGNHAAHDPAKVNAHITRPDAVLCKSQYREIVHWLYGSVLKSKVPESLADLIDEREPDVELTRDTPWEHFKSACHDFSPQYNYILIAPPKVAGCSDAQSASLASDIWGLVFDFDPDSKNSGLLHAAEQYSFSREIKPITIKQRANLSISNSRYITNWVFANGMRGMDDTVTSGEMEWRSPKFGYPGFIEKVLAEYFGQKTQRTVIVFLWDNVSYIRTILERISEKISLELVRYVFACPNDEELIRLKGNVASFESVSHFCNISLNEICSGFESINNPGGRAVRCLQVPTKDEEDREQLKDISQMYVQYRDAGIEPLYIGIELDEEQEAATNFYAGDKISWKDISTDADVRRNIKDSFSENIRKLLESIRESEQFTLVHAPGAGGSTLARRVAYEFHTAYPTILLTKYHRFKDKTHSMLFNFASQTQKTVLAVVEAYQVNQNDLKELIRRCNQDSKRILFLYVKRESSIDSRKKGNERCALLNACMSNQLEQSRFVARFEKIAANPKNITALASRNPATCEVIDFALSANESSYNLQAIGSYISSYLEELRPGQRDFAIFAAMQYRYTQKSISETAFHNLFSRAGLTNDLAASADGEPLRKLLSQEHDSALDCDTEYWRPRYSRFAFEILKIGLMGKVPDESTENDWKDYLSDWAVKYIKCCKENNCDLTEEIEELLRSLFLERNNEDFLQVDEKKKFAQIIDDIGSENPQRQSIVLEALVESYPDNHHFRGHWARFLYEMARDIPDYEKAAGEIEEAIDSGNNDFVMWHLGGMCRKRKINFMIERYKTDPDFRNDNPDIEEQIQTLTEDAYFYYNKSRTTNARNLYVHSAAIGLILDVLDFGREVQGNPPKESFLADSKNWWYTKHFEILFELLDEAKYITEESTRLDSATSREKDRHIINVAEAKIYALIGDYGRSIEIFDKLAETSNTTMRPYYRKLYVYSNLLSKVNNPNELHRAWCMLSKAENASMLKAVERNISEQPDNVGHIKDWMRLVRYSEEYRTYDYVIDKMQQWYDRCDGLSRLEASYYLYVFNACKAIAAGDSFNRINVSQAKHYIDECKKLSVNDRHSFEWLGKGAGVKSLISHKDFSGRPPFFQYSPHKSPLQKVKGVVTYIETNRKGTIQLECGLEAYFVPVISGLIPGRDETNSVECFISFRYNGLEAWNVRKITEEGEVRDEENISNDAVDNYLYPGENIERKSSAAPVKPAGKPKSAPDEKPFTIDRPKAELKIVGYIDPEKLKKKR